MPEPKDVERCEYMHVHEAIVNQVNQNMPDEEVLYDLAELFKIFGDSTRIKILYVLFESEMCVSPPSPTSSALSSRAGWSRPAGRARPYSILWPTGTCAPYWTRGWSTWRSCCLCIFYKEMETLP